MAMTGDRCTAITLGTGSMVGWQTSKLRWRWEDYTFGKTNINLFYSGSPILPFLCFRFPDVLEYSVPISRGGLTALVPKPK